MRRNGGARLSRLAATAALLVSALAGCGQACTDLDCLDRVSTDISDTALANWGATTDEPVTIEVCVDALCEVTEVLLNANGTARRSADFAARSGFFDLEAGHRVSVTVMDAAGNTVLEEGRDNLFLDTFEPNGPACSPKCGVAVIAIDPSN